MKLRNEEREGEKESVEWIWFACLKGDLELKASEGNIKKDMYTLPI